MTNALDIYVWSIEDKHEVNAAIDDDDRAAVLAVFNDVQVARNFRDWLLRDIDTDALYEFVEVLYGRYPARAEHRAIRDIINERRKHPALDVEHYRKLLQTETVAYLK